MEKVNEKLMKKLVILFIKIIIKSRVKINLVKGINFILKLFTHGTFNCS
jgi:hypothetical protein